MLPSQIRIGNFYRCTGRHIVTPGKKMFHWWCYDGSKVYSTGMNEGDVVMLLDAHTSAKNNSQMSSWLSATPRRIFVFLHNDSPQLIDKRHFELFYEPIEVEPPLEF